MPHVLSDGERALLLEAFVRDGDTREMDAMDVQGLLEILRNEILRLRGELAAAQERARNASFAEERLNESVRDEGRDGWSSR